MVLDTRAGRPFPLNCRPSYSQRPPACARVQGVGVVSPSLRCEIGDGMKSCQLWLNCIVPAEIG